MSFLLVARQLEDQMMTQDDRLDFETLSNELTDQLYNLKSELTRG